LAIVIENNYAVFAADILLRESTKKKTSLLMSPNFESDNKKTMGNGFPLFTLSLVKIKKMVL